MTRDPHQADLEPWDRLYVLSLDGPTPAEPRPLWPAGPALEGDAPAGEAPAGAKCPAVVEVHGGPMGMYGAAFFFGFQLLAAAGMAVV